MLSSGGYREEVTPGPIPNPEAKLFIADNTADFICGNVGRRLSFFIFNPQTNFLQSQSLILIN